MAYCSGPWTISPAFNGGTALLYGPICSLEFDGPRGIEKAVSDAYTRAGWSTSGMASSVVTDPNDSSVVIGKNVTFVATPGDGIGSSFNSITLTGFPDPPPPVGTGIRFPISTPPDREGHGDRFEDSRTEFEPEIGSKRRRHRMRSSPRIFDVRWTFKQSDYQRFDDWWQNTIKGGLLPFDLQLLDDDHTLVWYTVYVFGGKYTANVTSDRLDWIVSFQVRTNTDSFDYRPSRTDELAGLGYPTVFAFGNIEVYTPFRGLVNIDVLPQIVVRNDSSLFGYAYVGLGSLPGAKFGVLPLYGTSLAEVQGTLIYAGIPIYGLVTLNVAATAQFATNNAYPNAVLADNPVLYYRLNELSGGTVNDLGSANSDGTLVGVYSFNQGGMVNGGSSIAFVGPNDPGPHLTFFNTITDNSSLALSTAAVGTINYTNGFRSATTDSYVRIGSAGSVPTVFQGMDTDSWTLEGFLTLASDEDVSYVTLFSLEVGGASTTGVIFAINNLNANPSIICYDAQTLLSTGSQTVRSLAPSRGQKFHWAVVSVLGKMRFFINGQSCIYRVDGSSTYDWVGYAPYAGSSGTVKIGSSSIGYFANKTNTILHAIQFSPVARYTGSFASILEVGSGQAVRYYADFAIPDTYLNVTSGVHTNHSTNYTTASTLECWFSPANGSTEPRTFLISHARFFADTQNDFPIQLWWDQTVKKIKFAVSRGDDYNYDVILESPVLNPETTYYIAATYKASGSVKLYVNAQLVANQSYAYTNSSYSGPWLIGCAAEYNGGIGHSSVSGRIGEAALYATELSSAQILDHYLTARTYKQIVLDGQPSGYWRLGEATGNTAVNEISGGATGTYGGARFQGETGLLTSDTDKCVRFAGGGYVDISGYNYNRNFTLEAVIQVASGNGGAIVSHGQNSWYLRIISGKVQFVHSYNTIIATGTITVDTGIPVHITLTVDSSGNWKIFVNGVVDVSGTTSATFSAIYAFMIGMDRTPANTAGLEHLTGKIDEVAIYPGILSPEQIAVHAAAMSF